jgi:hypothetical protein
MFRKLYKFIKEYILRIKPIFKMKIKTSWFSNDYVYICYSTNNGWTWHTIVDSRRDIDETRWDKRCIDTLYVKVPDIQMFIKANHLDNLDSCRIFNSNVYRQVEEHNEKAYKKYIEQISRGRNYIKEYNSKY